MKYERYYNVFFPFVLVRVYRKCIEDRSAADALLIGWRTSAVTVPAEEERTAKVIVAVVTRAAVQRARTSTTRVVMKLRSQPLPALTTAFLIAILLDAVFATVSITRHHRGDIFDVSGKQLRNKQITTKMNTD